MKAYSQDLRQRVLRAIDQGKRQAEVAEMFVISTATIKRYLKARRERGHALPKLIPGRPSIKGAALQARLLEQLEANPDATREQHCQMWEARTGTRVSPASISRARIALGWTRKKRRYELASRMTSLAQLGGSKPSSCPLRIWSSSMRPAPKST
ncbi:MAG TPA: IS630 transposase-related protein [Ktedonobacteraceae bacterium]|nr:IS630 transposase-related protein [Ktedonobacteraceae bacterium]